MADISAFNADIEAEAPGCSIPRMKRAVRQAVREFCSDSGAWRYSFMTSAIKGVNTLSIDIPQDSRIINIHDVRVNDVPLRATNRKQLKYDMPDWDQSEGKPLRYFLNEEDEIAVAPKPDKDDVYAVHVDVSLKPVHSANVLDDIVLDRWYEIILHGALSKLLMQKDTGYTDRGGAELHLNLFREGIDKAAAQATNDNVYRGGVTAYGGL
jgi:hypothetical protein